jgi:hypothetical protein
MDNSETFTSQPVNRRSFLKKGVLEAGAAAYWPMRQPLAKSKVA